jgi:hypothetical protein
MKPLFLVALLAASATACAQSGSNIGSNTGGSASINRPAPPAVPSTGSSADDAGIRGTSPRFGETGVASPTLAPAARASGRCDTLAGEERAKCLREQASTGTTGPTSTGTNTGAKR